MSEKGRANIARAVTRAWHNPKTRPQMIARTAHFRRYPNKI